MTPMVEFTHAQERLGLKPGAMASALGITRQHLWAVQQGKATPSMTLKLLLRELVAKVPAPEVK